jgi:hypothetical protein
LSEHPARPGRLASIAGLAVLPALAGVAMAAGAPQIVGITSVVLNDVRISSASAPQPRRAALRERVALADQVQTGPRSQLQLMLLDKSVFSVGANARLTIDRYVYDPNLGRSFSATVAKGAFRFMSGQPDRRGSSSINTPVAAIGIRGTIVDGVIGKDAIEIAKHERGIPDTIKGDAETASLIVLRGPGPQTQGNVLPGAISVSAGARPWSWVARCWRLMFPRAERLRLNPSLFHSRAWRGSLPSHSQPFRRAEHRGALFRSILGSRCLVLVARIGGTRTCLIPHHGEKANSLTIRARSFLRPWHGRRQCQYRPLRT